MKKENGLVVACTEKELYDLYITFRNGDITYDDYKQAAIDSGCTISEPFVDAEFSVIQDEDVPAADNVEEVENEA